MVPAGQAYYGTCTNCKKRRREWGKKAKRGRQLVPSRWQSEEKRERGRKFLDLLEKRDESFEGRREERRKRAQFES